MASHLPPTPRTALSPHLQVYRLPLTALLSITHRISGALLAVLFLALNGLFAIAAVEPALFEKMTHDLAQPLGRILIGSILLSLNYHLVHGIRHLFWDIGMGFRKKCLLPLALLEILATLLLTGIAILAPLYCKAGAVS